jgi:hypothetical protein
MVDSTRMLRFGWGNNVYTFPNPQYDYRDNFGNVVPRTVKLPGVAGGFDEYGDDPAPGEIGSISFTFYLEALARSEMTAKRDAVRKMLSWGKSLLYMQPSDPALAERFCFARLNNVDIPENREKHTDLFQRVALTFQSGDPYWLSIGTENSAFWGDQVSYYGDNVTTWGGATTPTAISGLSTTVNVTRSGSAIVQPRLLFRCASGQTITNPIVQRLINNVVVDQVSWTGTLGSYEVLDIDCRGMAVRSTQLNAYNNLAVITPWWLRLYPGVTNTLKVLLANSGDACSLRVAYYEGWY